MTQLRIYHRPEKPLLELESGLPIEISDLLDDSGIPYQQFTVGNVSQVEDKAAFVKELQQMLFSEFPEHRFGYCTMVAVEESYPNYDSVRLKYLSEHTLDHDEAYLILEGRCQLNFHLAEKVIQLECSKGDFVIVPALTLHWIDFGHGGQVIAVKCTSSEEMPVISYTGSNISDRFPRIGSA